MCLPLTFKSKQTNKMLAEVFLQQLFCRESSTLLFWLCAEGGPGWEQLGRCSGLWALQRHQTLFKELICKVWELIYKYILIYG